MELSDRESLALNWSFVWRGVVVGIVPLIILYSVFRVVGLSDDTSILMSNLLGCSVSVFVLGPLWVIPQVLSRQFSGYRLKIDRSDIKSGRAGATEGIGLRG